MLDLIANNAKDTVLDLITKGLAIANAVETSEGTISIKDSENAVRVANAYLAAANSVMMSVGSLYDDLIDLPDFVALRRFRRRWNI